MAGARTALELLTTLIAPPRCGACAAPCEVREPLCESCAADLRRSRGRFFAVLGTDAAWATTPYEGTAQRLVAALKFAGRLPLADAAAATIATSIPTDLVAGALVPVPAAPQRRRTRGFDPTALITTALSTRLDLPYKPCLARSDGPRQVGRPRRQRLSDPPLVRTSGHVPEAPLLIDDVTTTGATLAACAVALRAAGARRVIAVTFARTPGR